MPSEVTVEYERRDNLAILWLNRPAKLNALDEATMRRLRECLFILDDDDRVDTGVIAGRGRAFCSGADIGALQLRDTEEIHRLGGVQPRDAQLRDLVFRFTQWKPLVAAVHGYALGGGLHLALLCDLLVVEDEALLQVSETGRGTDPSVFWEILRSRGSESFATEVVLSGRRWSGREAASAGIATASVPAGQGISRALELAATIAANPAPSVRATVKARRTALELLEVRAQAARDPRLHLSDWYRSSAQSFHAQTRDR